MEQDFNSKFEFLLREDRLPFTTSKEEARKRVMARTVNDDHVIPLNSSRGLYTKLAVAASIAVLLGFSFFYFSSDTTVNQSGSVMAHTLPDGSTVYLNRGAEVSYSDLSWAFSRDLDFEGSGFFDVKEGSKFTVSTNLGDVSVLGTSFSVITYENLLKVSCKTGKVLVENGANLSATLTPGDGVEMSSSSMKEISVDTRFIDNWVDGTYRFDNVEIEEVLNSIEDFTGYQIEYPENLNQKYSGEFSTSQTTEEILDIVCKPAELTYELIENENLIKILNK